MSPERSGAAADTFPPACEEPHDLGDTDDSLDFLRRAFERHGGLFRVYAPARRAWAWVVSDPDDVHRVLVANHRNYTKGVGIDRVRLLLGDGLMTSEGTLWRRQRRMLQPAFSRRGVERLVDVIRAAIDAQVDAWSRAAAADDRVDVTASTSRFALDVILAALFGDDLPRLLPDPGRDPFLRDLAGAKRDARFAYEFRRFGRDVLELLRSRRSSAGCERHDLLQGLLDARHPDDGSPMDESEVLDEVLTLVIAGHETTASALNWTLSLLARHQESQQRIATELAVTGNLDDTDFTALARWPCLGRSVDESLRLYPPGWLLTRRSIGADQIGGHALPPRTDVFVSPFLVHRHPEHWTEPEAFDPARFEAARVEARHAFAYIPFAAGPRHCIGENLSRLEMTLFLAGVLRRFRLHEPQPAEPALAARINLRTATNVHMSLSLR